MSVSFDHRHAGTPESAWMDHAPWKAAAPLSLDAVRLVVLAAHPDDETLGAGGLIAVSHARGMPVHVVVVTDGEASHPESPGGGVGGADRRAESAEALRRLAPGAQLTFLGFDDGRIREDRAAIARAIGPLVRSDAGPVLLASPWSGDGHRDHRVLGEIAAELRDEGTCVIGYPIWLWHWGTPADVSTTGWRVLALDDATIGRKAHAVAAHHSQLHAFSDAPGDEAIVGAPMRAHFARPFEVFVEHSPAAVRGSVGDSYFAGLYERHVDPWGFDTRWYEQRKRDLLVATLPSSRYRTALEVGAATGALTAALAVRVDALLGIDLSADALARAADRCRDLANVRFETHRVPDSWPGGAFDLIVVSEIAYYLGADDRAALIGRIRDSLTVDGTVVACHWRHPIAEAPADGDTAHAELARDLGLLHRIRHQEDDFVLDVFVAAGVPSPAEQERLR